MQIFKTKVQPTIKALKLTEESLSEVRKYVPLIGPDSEGKIYIENEDEPLREIKYGEYAVHYPGSTFRAVSATVFEAVYEPLT